VDWYPWGPEALERAKREGRPLFVSVGYAACHWCHVMEHESFEDAETARLLSEAFVCVKVDREERPDLDRVYMAAVQAISGRGGWPMTVLCLPDGRPFWGGTYLPRESLRSLVAQVRKAWATQRPSVERQAAVLAGHVRELLAGAPERGTAASDSDVIQATIQGLSSQFDASRGGYGSRPKFPPHAELLFFLDERGARGGEPGLRQARRTLEAMEEGGIHDQVGGGFHRYSTDERWLLPHFEKMLYDNALLAQAYARAAATWNEPRFARTAAATLAWIRREMSRPGGGYASSLDADTDGHEGLTYTWTPEELRAALGADAPFAASVFGVQEGGNFRDEASGRPSGRNVLHLPEPLAEVARRHGLAPEALSARMDAIRARLLQVRATRRQPGLDEKVIVGWNGLLLSAFAAAAAANVDARALDDARRLAAFLLGSCRRADGTLLRFPRESGPEIVGFCEDHVHLIEGLLDLADASREESWATAARDVADRLLAAFEDREGGGFWTGAAELHEPLFARSKEAWDSPIPSDQATAARALLRLHARTGDVRYRDAADRTLAAYRPLLSQGGGGRGLVGLVRALADRRALEASGHAAAGAPARGDVHVRADVASVDAFVERGEVPPGGRTRFGLRVALDPGWHANGASVADAKLVPTALALGTPAPLALDAVVHPPGARYEGTFWIRGSLVAPAGVPLGPRRVTFLLTLQPCDATSCRAPVEIRVDVPIRIADREGEARHGAVFGR
jgi:uncharacterized protein YyaL (SSP411 family)